MSKNIEIIIHDIETDGLPDMKSDELTGRVAFIFDGCIISGRPVIESSCESEVPWEDAHSGTATEYWGVKKWVEFPIQLYKLNRKVFMNRDIKFRRWNGVKIIAHENLNMAVKNINNTKQYPHDVIMQCTGLKDKNNKEIYEDDILSHEEKGLYQVVFKNGCFKGFNNRHYMSLDILLFNSMHSVGEAIVVGNIYENPELLN